MTGTVDGLASNIKTKSGTQVTAEDIQNNNFISNNNFYIQAGISTGYSKSKQESKSHTEKAVVTDIKGLDENAKITYNDSKNIKYQGTQAQDTTFVYNNVENITKEAVELNNYYKSKGNSSGIGINVGLTSNEPSISLNVNASKNKLNTDETVYQNGSFVDVNEVHNNTKNMQLSGFTQTGGKVTGNIENLNIESKQNTSKTKGDTKGTNLGVNLLTGTPTGNISASRTKGDRNFVDNQSTFVVGKDSNLKIGNVDNTASIIGTTDNGKIAIENYTGKNLENSNKLKTVGSSVGTSGVGINYSKSEKEGIARNTVIGNVSIDNTNNSDINYDITKANEITKDSSSSTNVYVEDNLVKAIANPEEFKNKIEVAKIEVDSLKNSVTKSIDNILNGDKSQDISKPERRQLEEIKEAVIRVQTAKEIEAIATKDLTDPKVQAELGVEIEKFNSNDPNLSPKVKERIEYLRSKGETVVAFYDKSTDKIFINETAKENEIRPSIAREWKIREDLKEDKGKLNAEGKVRATVAGEIAYNEVLGRTEKKPAAKLNINNLVSAKMNLDSEVSADIITKEDREKRILLRDTYVYKNLPDGVRTAFGAGEVIGSVGRAGRAYILIKTGSALLAIPEPTLIIKAVGGGLVLYGAAEGAFAASNSVEGIQETYYGYTNQKDKVSINPGKILLGEDKYIILDNISASAGTQAFQIADYTKTKAETEKATKTLSNRSKISNQSKPTFIVNNGTKQKSVYPNFDFDHVIGGDVSKNGKKVTGGHSLVKGDVRISKVIDKPDINGVYNAEVEIYNPVTQKWELKITKTENRNTMFPFNWTEERIKSEIRSAWDSKEFRVITNARGKSWQGTSESGIKIEGYINPDKTTAYPIYNGER